MNNFKLAYRNLFRKKQNTAIKILSLGTGLAVGLVLLSKVYFEQNYDDFYPDVERIYRVETRVIRNDEPKEYGQVSGAIAPGIKVEVPGVEQATRYTSLTWGDAVFYTQDKNRYNGSFIMADENFFDVLPRPMIIGNAKEILSRSMYAIVSQSLAKKMGGDVVGKIVQIESYPGKEITIGGVFADIPENSSVKCDAIVSLESIGQFFWDGRNNWEGNDRYLGFVKLAKGVKPESLAPAIRQMQEKNQPMEEMRKSGVDLSYALVPLGTLHSNSKSVQTITLVLSVIAFALLLTAVLNYLLIVITSLMQRSKEIAVNKCYGASGSNIFRIISAETVLNFTLSILFAVLLLFFFRSTVEEVLGASLLALFSSKTILLLLVVCLVIFAVSVFFPANVLQRIPVVSVFRNKKQSKQNWKLGLLFIQFASAAFLLILTATVSKQYHFMVTDNPGYDYKNVLYLDLSGVDSIGKQRILSSFQQLPSVESASLSSTLPLDYMSGNNVTVEGNDQELFNIADMYYADESFIPLMNIPIVAGKNFDETCDARSALVSEAFRDKMKTMLGWDDVVGKDVIISEHGLTHIVGVIPNIRISSISNQDTRPAVLFFSANHSKIIQHYTGYLLIKLKDFDAESIRTVNQTVSQLLPEREVSFIPYSDSIVKSYDSERLFRNAITIGGIITLIISLLGLIGYVNNEISLRTAEIAIRKINGATLTDILRLFVTKILVIALPAVIIGCIVTYFVGDKIMSNFSTLAGFAIWEYILCALVLLLLIEIVVVINCIKIANQNPIDSLRN